MDDKKGIWIGKTPLWAMIAVTLSTLLTSTAQLLFKIGSEKLAFDISILLQNYPLFLGFFLYGIAAAILIKSLKYGELSILYPLIALSYVWVTILSYFYLSEALTFYKIIGVFVIIMGVTFIGIGSSKESSKQQSDTMSEIHG